MGKCAKYDQLQESPRFEEIVRELTNGLGQWQRTKTICNPYIDRGDLIEANKVWFSFFQLCSHPLNVTPQNPRVRRPTVNTQKYSWISCVSVSHCSIPSTGICLFTLNEHFMLFSKHITMILITTSYKSILQNLFVHYFYKKVTMPQFGFLHNFDS